MEADWLAAGVCAAHRLETRTRSFKIFLSVPAITGDQGFKGSEKEGLGHFMVYFDFGGGLVDMIWNCMNRLSLVATHLYSTRNKYW